ncbi:MAG: TetR/AcrR family transcriptional regulator [Steroidobacteraceae bacterium]
MLISAIAQARFEALRPLVPDPCRPCYEEPDHLAGRRVSRRALNQRRSRSQILGSARQLVAEAGLANVHMQAVAERSGVSIQTLYNVVGTRAEMLSSAATEWMISLARNAVRSAEVNDVNVTFAMIESFWAGSVEQRRYTCNLVDDKGSHALLEGAFVRDATAVVAKQLALLQSSGRLVEWVSVPLLARHIAFSSHACIRQWLAAPYDESRFRDTLVNSCGLLLRGAVCGAELERVERGLSGTWSATPLAN